MKQQADKHRNERKFEVGDWVFLRLQPYRQIFVNVHPSKKLLPRFYGPYKVLERIGYVASFLSTTITLYYFHRGYLYLACCNFGSKDGQMA
jgi:hypothetical protein